MKSRKGKNKETTHNEFQDDWQSNEMSRCINQETTMMKPWVVHNFIHLCKVLESKLHVILQQQGEKINFAINY